jgi:RNA polymerase sigma factor (sigma-70 family)
MELIPEEQRLVQDCLKRERRAQKELYDRYKDAMYTIARRISNNSDDAGDTLQDAFVQVFRDLHQYSGQSTLGAWIKTIVIRTALRNVKMTPLTESMEVVTGREEIEWPEALNGEYLHQAILVDRSGRILTQRGLGNAGDIGWHFQISAVESQKIATAKT